MQAGRVHLYWGDGKGKTTAAMGLALRALGAGRRVVIVQFLKSGQSSELEPLRRLGAQVYAAGEGVKFSFVMSSEEKAAVRVCHTDVLRAALQEPCELLVLDEACAAYAENLVDPTLLQQAVCGRPPRQEVVLTGRSPAPWMEQIADYSTEMCCHKHPYTAGVPARKGIEF
jgi:cob(I)alamin adenosyltransferase